MKSETEILNIEDAILKNGFIVKSTSGVSMWPMLRHRKDMVVIEQVNRPLRKYDVPLYRGGANRYILHRIIGIKPDGTYIIRGDNTYTREYVKPERVVGVLREFYRNGKHVVCAESKGYKVYIGYKMVSYPFRKIFKIYIKPPLWRILSKIKHIIFK